MKLSSIKVNSSRLEAGAWVDNIPEMDDLRLRVRGMGNKDAVKLTARLIDAVPRAQKINGKVDPAVMEGISAQVLAETVLLGWDNVTDDVGAPVPFTPDAAKAILSDPDMVAFSNAVVWAARSLADAEAVALEDDGKNSEAPSGGASNGLIAKPSSST